MSNNLRQAAQAALESALDEWIETDPDMAERWITEKLAQLALKQRLKDRRAALAEPQPEPVGEWVRGKYGNYPYLKWRQGYVAEIGQKVYAAPQAQQPLTDGQIDATYCESQDQDLRPQDKSRVFAFARAIERAHGIGVKP